MCLCAEHLIFSLLYLVPECSAAKQSIYVCRDYEAKRQEAMCGMWYNISSKIQSGQVLFRLCLSSASPSENRKRQETEVENGQIRRSKAGYILGLQTSNNGGEYKSLYRQKTRF